jgi:hypothetical protein
MTAEVTILTTIITVFLAIGAYLVFKILKKK